MRAKVTLTKNLRKHVRNNHVLPDANTRVMKENKAKVKEITETSILYPDV